MNVKHAFAIILLFLLLFSTVSMVSADDDRSYAINQAFVDLTVGSDGLLHVDERYDYSFDGKFNGVYRDIPLKEGESIDNIQVYVDGAYAEYVETEEDGYKHIKIYLYSDKEKTQGIRDCNVNVYLSYDMKNVVTLFNDVGGLQYKLWGDEWDVGVGKLYVNVYLPGDKDNEYFLNPQEFNASSSIEGNTISAETTSIPKGDFYEVLVMMPLSDFDNATYAKHVNQNGKEMIKKNLEDSINGRNFWNTTYLILGLLSVLGPVGAVFTYLRYGREPKVDYDGIYERELPTDDAPEVVNAMYSKGSIGEPDMKGFEAVILKLIDKKVFRITKEIDEGSELNDLYIKFAADTSGLSSSEKMVYDILHHFSNVDILNISQLSNSLSSESNAKWFMDKYEAWAESVGNEIKPKYEREFNDTGNVIAGILSFGGLAFGIILIILGVLTELSSGGYAVAGGIILIITSIVCFYLADDKFGQWTPEGRVNYLKWRNFKEFLEDNSLIKEHPPESIAIWRQYLIYGAALGIADEVYESMKLNAPDYVDYDDDLIMYHHYGGYGMMYSALDTGVSTANPSSDSGGFGSVGGGSGGGGGGAF